MDARVLTRLIFTWGERIGRIQSALFLSVLFFLFLAPLGFFMRWVRRSAKTQEPVTFLITETDAGAASYRIPSRVREPQSMERPY